MARLDIRTARPIDQEIGWINFAYRNQKHNVWEHQARKHRQEPAMYRKVVVFANLIAPKLKNMSAATVVSIKFVPVTTAMLKLQFLLLGETIFNQLNLD
ncbi:unnamed protein product [Eruca vesicaria subsp. sativa]|uniref:Uncharacterized protein n=1 Tax=Eruca vesicaria subsp. sativa TaxID=29727 RepID=A0ABC8LWE9_ERUVS|nr:unnamed protein product [Eruca vesicaria subsp. sativa]